MNFRGHFKGGLAAGAVSAGVALAGGYVDVDSRDWSGLMTDPLGRGDLQTLLGVALTGWLMALFPDLDTASIPQRWYLRLMLLAMVLVFLAGRQELFALLAFMAILPLVHQHRGWTHWKITPWALFGFLSVVDEYFRARDAWWSGFSWENVADLMGERWPFLVACVLGHYTHLLLDSRSVRWLPFVRNAPGHH